MNYEYTPIIIKSNIKGTATTSYKMVIDVVANKEQNIVENGITIPQPMAYRVISFDVRQ